MIKLTNSFCERADQPGSYSLFIIFIYPVVCYSQTDGLTVRPDRTRWLITCIYNHADASSVHYRCHHHQHPANTWHVYNEYWPTVCDDGPACRGGGDVFEFNECESTQQTRDIGPMLGSCWTNVENEGSVLTLWAWSAEDIGAIDVYWLNIGPTSRFCSEDSLSQAWHLNWVDVGPASQTVGNVLCALQTLLASLAWWGYIWIIVVYEMKVFLTGNDSGAITHFNYA